MTTPHNRTNLESLALFSQKVLNRNHHVFVVNLSCVRTLDTHLLLGRTTAKCHVITRLSYPVTTFQKVESRSQWRTGSGSRSSGLKLTRPLARDEKFLGSFYAQRIVKYYNRALLSSEKIRL